MRASYGARVWAGLIVYLIALLGTLLLANESARPWAVLLLVVSAVLAVVLWGRTKLGIGVFIGRYCSDRRIPQTLVLFGWSLPSQCCLSSQRTFAMRQRQLRRSGSQASYGSQA